MSPELLIRTLATSKAIDLLSRSQTDGDSQLIVDALLHLTAHYPEGNLSEMEIIERMMTASREFRPGPVEEPKETVTPQSQAAPATASLRDSFMASYKPFNVLDVAKDIQVVCDENEPPHVADLHLDGPALIALYERPIDPNICGLALLSAYIDRGAKMEGNFYRTTAVEPPFNLDEYHVDHLFKCADDGGLHEINLRFDIAALHRLYHRSVDLEKLPAEQVPSVYQECGGVVHDRSETQGVSSTAAIREFSPDGTPLIEAHYLNGKPYETSEGSLRTFFEELSRGGVVALLTNGQPLQGPESQRCNEMALDVSVPSSMTIHR